MIRFSPNVKNHQSYLAEETVTAFASLFRGLPDAWGTITGQCVKEKVTLEHYRRHLYGKVSLGIYPLRRDGQCRWFAVDIDRDDIVQAIAPINQFAALGFNGGVYLERSKSKGFHVYAFPSDWVPARDVRLIARCALKQVGFTPSTEIFPKQDSIGPDAFGNYLNLPYFGPDNEAGRRMILDLKSRCPIPISAWLEDVQVFPVHGFPFVLENLPREEAKQKQGHTSKEIVEMLQMPAAIGERRPTLIKLAGYLSYRGVPEDVAISLLLPWAEKRFVEPLPPQETERHIRGIYRRYGTRTLGIDEAQLVEEIPNEIEEMWK